MKKILFFPLLKSMPSGHHQVAEAIMEYVSDYGDNVECKKVDLLSEWNPAVEAAIVKIYKGWIHQAPDFYGLVYRIFANNSKSSRSHRFYELLLMEKMEEILAREKPDLVICTHALPSYLLNQLKNKGKCPAPCLNVYTDFFINKVWGISGIDYHFVPTRRLKKQLITQHSVPENRIFITGIPASSHIKKNQGNNPEKAASNLLIFGGGMKVEKIMGQLRTAGRKNEWNYQILNSTNNKSFKNLSGKVQLLPDIASKETMNDLYSGAIAFITKPGGVLISEGIKKELPIFVHTTLPGQEEINLRYLIEQKLVFKVPPNSNMVDFVSNKLEDSLEMEAYKQHIREYAATLELKHPKAVYDVIEQLLTLKD